MTRFVGQLGAQVEFVDRVEMMRAQPESSGIWHDTFHTKVRFNSNQNGVWFNRQLLRSGALMGDPQLSAFNESMVRSYLGSLNQAPYTHRVKQLVLAQLETAEPAIGTIAQTLNLTERSLRRHLQEEGATFRDLLHQGRMELAEHYLTKSTLSITEISLRVGFADTSNFSRAFAREFGRRPSEYREACH